MRHSNSKHDKVLLTIGSLLKTLFVGMFICTVLAIVFASFGYAAQIAALYEYLWSFFWKICLTLIGGITIFIMLDALR